MQPSHYPVNHRFRTRDPKRISAIASIVLLIGLLAALFIFLRLNAEGPPRRDMSDIESIGFNTINRVEIQGEHGEMVELEGEYNGGQAVVVIHTGSERGWNGVTAEARVRIYDIVDRYPDPLGFVRIIGNVFVACERFDTCENFYNTMRDISI